MRAPFRTLLLPAAVLAGAFTPLVAPLAYAASGSFTYTAGDGTTKTSGAPPSGQCLAVVGSGPVRNATDRPVTLYKGSDCQRGDQVARVGAMEADKNVPTFQSAYWAE
jgi:hypothetical protein